MGAMYPNVRQNEERLLVGHISYAVRVELEGPQNDPHLVRGAWASKKMGAH